MAPMKNIWKFIKLS